VASGQQFQKLGEDLQGLMCWIPEFAQYLSLFSSSQNKSPALPKSRVEKIGHIFPLDMTWMTGFSNIYCSKSQAEPRVK
jgi:hypothetical protein